MLGVLASEDWVSAMLASAQQGSASPLELGQQALASLESEQQVLGWRA